MQSHDERDGERRSIRLAHYDYAADGTYFVTVCTRQHVCLFGDVARGAMLRNAIGEIVATTWRDIVHHFPNVTLDEWVVMPNHVHGIMVLKGVRPPLAAVAVAAWRAAHPVGDDGLPNGRPRGPARGSVGVMIGSFKSAATKRINLLRNTPEGQVWQRGYHERVIDGTTMLANTRRYIAANVRRWSTRCHRFSTG